MNDYFLDEFALHVMLSKRYAPIDVSMYYELKRRTKTHDEFKATLFVACVLYSNGWPS